MPTNLDKLKILSDKLLETESELSAFWHLAPNLFIVCEKDGKIVKTNLAWKRILGYTTEELVGTYTRDLCHPDDIERSNVAREKAFKDQAVKDFIARYKRKDGSYVTICWNVVLNYSDRYVYGIGREITDGRMEGE